MINRSPNGWQLALDARDAEGRTPVNKVVPNSEMWRVTAPSSELDQTTRAQNPLPLASVGSTVQPMLSPKSASSPDKLLGSQFDPPTPAFVPMVVDNGSPCW